MSLTQPGARTPGTSERACRSRSLRPQTTTGRQPRPVSSPAVAASPVAAPQAPQDSTTGVRPGPYRSKSCRQASAPREPPGESAAKSGDTQGPVVTAGRRMSSRTSPVASSVRQR